MFRKGLSPASSVEAATCQPGELLALELAGSSARLPARLERQREGLLWLRVLAPPEEVERPAVGSAVTLWQVRVNDARYRCPARLERAEPPPAGLLGFRPLAPWERVQARNAARLSDERSLAAASVEVVGPSGAVAPARVLDLSATGAGLQTGLALGPGEAVDVRLDLPGAGRFMLRAQVVRRLPERSGVALRFVGTPTAVEDRLFAFVLRQQALRRRLRCR
jgi:hypothetical protein